MGWHTTVKVSKWRSVVFLHQGDTKALLLCDARHLKSHLYLADSNCSKRAGFAIPSRTNGSSLFTERRREQPTLPGRRRARAPPLGRRDADWWTAAQAGDRSAVVSVKVWWAPLLKVSHSAAEGLDDGDRRDGREAAEKTKERCGERERESEPHVGVNLVVKSTFSPLTIHRYLLRRRRKRGFITRVK